VAIVRSFLGVRRLAWRDSTAAAPCRATTVWTVGKRPCPTGAKPGA